MTGIAEAANSQLLLEPSLKAGVDTLGQKATVNFVKYNRVVLPADGFVFWVRAVLLSPSALANSSVANGFTANQAQVLVQDAPNFDASGYLHHTTTTRQFEDESLSVNTMVFTSETVVNNLNDIAPNTLWIATSSNERYAFSSRSMFSRQASLYHYRGDAVYPALASQIVDYPYQINALDVVVSNSLPIWLSLNKFFPVYPSMLVPDNLRPPYAVVHIGEDDTTPMQAGTVKDSTGTLWQLAKDVVQITTFGIRNNTIMDWLEYIKGYTLENPGILGIMNSPIPRDAKRGQTEISTIAQKKRITFDASYYQARVNMLSRQLIKEAFISFIPEGGVIPTPHPVPMSGSPIGLLLALTYA